MPALAAWRFGPRRRYPRRAADPPGRRCVQCRSRQVGRCFGGTRHATRPRWCPRSLHKAWEGPTSTDRAVLAARPAPTRASRIAASFTEIGHVVVGRHLQQFPRHPVGSFLDALPRFAFHLRRLGSVKIAHVGGAAAAFLHRSPLFLCEVQRRSGWALRPHQSIGPNLDRSVIVVSFLANPPCGEQSRCADHDVGLFGDVVWGGVRPRLSTTWVSICTPSPYRGRARWKLASALNFHPHPPMLRHAYDRITATRRSNAPKFTRATHQTAKLERAWSAHNSDRRVSQRR